MSVDLTGSALQCCEEHPQAHDIDSTARLTFAAMASFAELDEIPICRASQSIIGARCGLHRSAVHGSIKRLADLGLLERVQARRGSPVHWRLRLDLRAEIVPTAAAPEVAIVRIAQRSVHMREYRHRERP